MPVKGSNLIFFALIALSNSNKVYPNFYWIDKDKGIFVLVCLNKRNRRWSPDFLNIYVDYAKSCRKQKNERSDPRQRFISALEKSEHLKRITGNENYPKFFRVYQIREDSLREYSEKTQNSLQSTVEMLASDSVQLFDNSDHDYADMSSPSDVSRDDFSFENSPSTDSDLTEPCNSSSPMNADLTTFNDCFTTEDAPLTTLGQVTSNQVTPTSDEMMLTSPDSLDQIDINNCDNLFSEEEFDKLCKDLCPDNEYPVDGCGVTQVKQSELGSGFPDTGNLDMEGYIQLDDIFNQNPNPTVSNFLHDEENKKNSLIEESYRSETETHGKVISDSDILSNQIQVVPESTMVVPAVPAAETAVNGQRPIYNMYIINVMASNVSRSGQDPRH